MKRRRIEITVSRRRTTIHLRHQPAGDTVEPTLHQADALHTIAANLPPANGTELLEPPATQLPHAMLALTNWGNENHLSEVEPEAELKSGSNETPKPSSAGRGDRREVFGKC